MKSATNSIRKSLPGQLLTKMAGMGLFAGTTAIAALVGARKSLPTPWYRSLQKPAGQPPAWVFGPVWTALYATIAYSGWRVWTDPPSARRKKALALWAAQMGLNAAWTPVFFGARKPKAALALMGALVPTVAWYAIEVKKVDRTAAAWMLPYLGWITYATYLNAGIVHLNPSSDQ